MNPEGIIYIAKNKDNGKIYVGQTIDFRVRFNHHKGEYKPSYFDRALKKHGPDKFRYIKITCPMNCLDYWERFFIEKLGSKYPGGYNLTEGGEGMRGYHISEETRKKLKARKCWNKGKHMYRRNIRLN